ncbi:hypothetical protein Sta7437_0767 [Stanieria cyanosphaera PCC 7437]|uniref:Nucleotidyltransferase family protein n=1 Tax=Stanieria cyanosphaera (strain ATCC 29371 / PCC 7437) TaxID=111780 RepID=K9XPA1_STAC7|nr:nucleotidyltransferase family protein [Stanieria cyanosphaera]AFZ34358.1 hypothetical protein Sta7437_0767 [Stanieria cyanosphaera PCC 7437]
MTTTLTKKDINSPLIVNQPEIELLLCCARSQVDEQTKVKIKNLVNQDLNWELLLEIGERHGLIPLLFYNLNKLCPQAIPSNIFSSLEQYFQAHVRRNLLLTAELLKILDIFKNNNIQAIPFKGPTLANYAYKNLTLRQFCDLDLLVRERDVPKIINLLTSLGYELPSPIAEIEQKPYLQYKNFLESKEIQRKYDFIHSQKQIAIDLQWSITEKRLNDFFKLDLEYLINNSQLTSLGGAKVAQFSLEDLLLYLCFHGSKHCWSELKWVCDVAELINNNPEIDWQKVEAQAQKIDCEKILELGLWLAYDLLQANIPKSIIASLEKNLRVQWLAQQSYRSIFERPPEELNKYIFISSLKSNISTQLVYFLTMLTTPTAKEWNYLKLPKSLAFLYSLVRPYRLFVEYFNSKKI